MNDEVQSLESEKRLSGKRVLIGVTGSIAAYKACEVVRMLKRENAEVRVMMTESATHFVGPLTFETLTGDEVARLLFPEYKVVKTRHVHLAEWAECILLCPATANIIGKMACGIADDFVSTLVMAARSPVVIAPAMDYQMVQNPVYLENCQKLKNLGHLFIDPESGELASGAQGPGRLASMNRIMDGVKKALLGNQRLKDVKVLVTAGPTRENMDPVRFLANASSGKMGFALAEEASLRGAEVTLISGPTALVPFTGIRTIHVTSAREMCDAVLDAWNSHHVLIMAAAVADFTPASPFKTKMKKQDQRLELPLEPTPDILGQVGMRPHRKTVVGFALETDHGVQNAMSKLKKKKLDLICLNNPLEPGCGFNTDTNRITIIHKDGQILELPLMPKWKAAIQIINETEKAIHDRNEHK